MFELQEVLRELLEKYGKKLPPAVVSKIRKALKESESKYADVVWTAGDVQTIKPDWSIKKCREALEEIETHLRDRTTELGWEVMECLLDEDESESED
jgi:hypothetical protein